jgi:MFS family permease
MFGALAAGPIAYIGKWKCIMLCNILIILGSSLCLFYKTNFQTFVAGRIILGVACGGFTVYCPKYINEVAPKELSGPAGGMFQLMVCFGIFLSLASTYAYDVSESSVESMDSLCFFLFALPIGLAFLQMFLMSFVFNYDTPKMMKENGETAKLRDFMGKLYEPYAVEKAIDEIVIEAKGAEDGVSYSATLCSPQYSKATFVGCFVSMF